MTHRSTPARIAFTLVLACTPAWGAGPSAEFVVMGASSDFGTVRAMLCAEGERFPNQCKRAARVPARAEGTRLVFENLMPGRYALSVVHDEDDSGRLGISSISGKPKGIGFSNNVTGPGGVPTFNLAAVQVREGGLQQVVRLRGFAFGR
ncbi:DUF2141 domain-containing protein [Pseudorhodoferax sp.]|uniref:DUF2141 domain-containing protein n=1 Tax=Pseudorhodoferax sp. TaxID=1993553 RepID=UPI002DD65CB2|nr:DUF2141 domain-containing protein [Pseudorhodoferax sp.]